MADFCLFNGEGLTLSRFKQADREGGEVNGHVSIRRGLGHEGGLAEESGRLDGTQIARNVSESDGFLQTY